MNLYLYPEKKDWELILKRPTQSLEDLEATVNQIFLDVQRNGDIALKKYTSMFDGVNLESLLVSQSEFDEAESRVSEALKKAIQAAKKNIESFHKSQVQGSKKIETVSGVSCWSETRAIERIGLYIPGGTAPLFSTVLMLAAPAKIAGCKQISLFSPPNKQGKIANEILYAAKLCGVDKVYKLGGIQAIAAMTFGTESIEKVYKIFGPGNQFVTAAKQVATKYGVAIDMPAGPSEVLVVADATSNPAFVAADLLSQAEHGVDSQVVLLSKEETVIEKVQSKIETQLAVLPRKEIAQQALNNSVFVVLKEDTAILEMINLYAPEHLILATETPDFFVQNVQNAGSVFIGNYAPESVGDYASGTNHTLPTSGFARAFSGVNLSSFTKRITFQEISKQGLENIAETVMLMAEAEGLQAHKNAVAIRLKS